MLLPHRITALVTKEKMASPLDYAPTLPQYWIEYPRDKAFGVYCNALSSKFTGFSIIAIPFTMKHHIFSNKLLCCP